MKFYFKEGYKNEYKDNNEKSCRLSRNRVSHKIDFKAVYPHEAMPTAWTLRSFEVKNSEKSQNVANRN